MKNIRIYTPDKYKRENYIEVKDNIYETVLDAEEKRRCTFFRTSYR